MSASCPTRVARTALPRRARGADQRAQARPRGRHRRHRHRRPRGRRVRRGRQPSPGRRRRAAPRIGLGLLGLAERVDLLGGTLESGPVPTAGGGSPPGSRGGTSDPRPRHRRRGPRARRAAHDPRRRRRHLGRRRGRGRGRRGRGDPAHPARRGADGHPHAAPRRAGRDGGDPRARRPAARPHPHDVRRRRLRVRAPCSAGADGFLLKDTPPRDLQQAVRVVAAGDSMLSPSVTRRLITHVADGPDLAGRPTADAAALATLSPREREVLVELARGRSNAEIGAVLFMSEATVKAHVTHLFTKLDRTNRVQLAILAHDAGLIVARTVAGHAHRGGRPPRPASRGPAARPRRARRRTRCARPCSTPSPASTSSSTRGSSTCTPEAARSASRRCRAAPPTARSSSAIAARCGRSTRTSPRSGSAIAPASSSATASLRRRKLPADLAFADPPYGFDDWPRLLRAVPGRPRRRRGRRRGAGAGRLGAGPGQALRPHVGHVPPPGRPRTTVSGPMCPPCSTPAASTRSTSGTSTSSSRGSSCSAT